MKIIDFHTHPFINDKHNSCFYTDTVTKSNFKEILNKAGIDHICGSVIYKTNNFDEIKKLNYEAMKLKEIWGDFYTPGIHIHPHYIEESINELQIMSAAGVNLIGELVPYYNGWKNYYDKNIHIIYEEIDKLNMIVSLHTDNDTDMKLLEEAIKRFKNIKFIAAHPNQKELYKTHIKLLNKYDNYFLDLSGTGLFRYGMLSNLVKNTSSEKILFGTDFPICNPKMYVEAVLFENLKSSDLDNILYKNAENLLNI